MERDLVQHGGLRQETFDISILSLKIATAGFSETAYLKRPCTRRHKTNKSNINIYAPGESQIFMFIYKNLSTVTVI